MKHGNKVQRANKNAMKFAKPQMHHRISLKSKIHISHKSTSKYKADKLFLCFTMGKGKTTVRVEEI